MKFKLFGIKFNISYTLLCLLSISVITGAFSGFICCMLSVIIHETGHLIFMYKYGSLPQKIKISLFEISINNSSRQEKSLKQNFLIIFFGPFANFICFILFYLLYLIGNEIFKQIALANLCVGIFNMLPVMSLDGGQLLYIFLRQRLSEKASEECVNITTFIILFPLAVLGFMVLFNSKYNFSLLFVCLYIILSLVYKNNRYY